MKDKAQELYAKKRAGKEVQKELEPFAMWSFILSIAPFLSVFGLWIPLLNILIGLLLLPAPILSIALGIASFSRIGGRKKYYGKGFAIAGIVISLLEIGIGILGILIFVNL